MSDLIVNLKDIEKKDLNLVGGKGLNLGLMTQAGFRIPEGFCVSTVAYDRFISKVIDNKLFKDLDNFKIEDTTLIKNVSKDIRKLIESTILEEETEREILRALNEFKENTSFAVRSSATAEDLKNASFAGQQDTYLNIKGKEEVLNHVKKCFASLYSERAVIYRIKNNIKHSDVKMCVVVQRLINPVSSGIVFTADPVSNNHDILTIDAGYGLGEALVSGIITPDLYKVNKTNFKIIEKTLGKKEKKIISIDNSGTIEEEIPKDLRNTQVLRADQILDLTVIAKKIESFYHCPQDIEWCIDESDNIYITQSRAITSLYPKPDVHANEGKRVYISFNHIQVMPKPIKPLGQSILKYLLPFGKDLNNLEVESPWACSIGGRLYLDYTYILNNFICRKIAPIALNKVDEKMASGIHELINRRDNSLDKTEKVTNISLIKNVNYIFNECRKGKKSLEGDNVLKNVEDFIFRKISIIEDIVNNSDNKVGAVKKCTSVLMRDVFTNVVPFIVPALKAMSNLKDYGTLEEVNKIVKGLEGNITTEMGLKVGDLGDLVRLHPDLLKALEENPLDSGLKIINSYGDEVVIDAFNEFFDKFGPRGVGEIDITNDRYSEDPSAIISTVISNAKNFNYMEHRKRYNSLIEDAKKTCKEIVEDQKSYSDKRSAMKLIETFRRGMPLREHPKYTLIKCFWIFKKALLQEGEKLKNNNLIDSKYDIYYLSLDEMDDVIKNNKDYKYLISKRKEDYKYYETLTAPRVILSNGEIMKGNANKNKSDNVLNGTPVSSGVVEGIARVILNPNEGQIKEGEILIAPFTDPGWTPLFVNAKGLVLEVGGLMTHGAVVAREYGIPAVVSVDDATKLIKTGDKIRVNGDEGTVEIIK